MRQVDIAARFGITQPQVSNYLTRLILPGWRDGKTARSIREREIPARRRRIN
jgi:predicted transcriptional regulator